MKKTILLYLTAIMIFSLTACGSAIEDKSDNTSNSTDINQTSDNENNSTQAATLTIDEVSADCIHNPDYETYIDYSGDYASTVIISTDADIANLRYIEIECTDVSDSGEATYTIGKTLYAIDKLTPERPLVISFSAPEIFPTRAFLYTDNLGNSIVLGILMSGEDGHFFFEEIQNIKN